MKNIYAPTLFAAAVVAASACSAQPVSGLIEGRWTQTSDGKELVLTPRVKLQPNAGYTYGTDLGGTAGYGSPTRTTIVTEPVLMEVARSMQLAITPGGQFEWTIVKRHAEKDDCIMTTTQTKRGKVVRGSGVLTFEVDGGTEAFSSSCGRQGTSQLGNSSERYDVQTSSNRLILSGGSGKWTFTRS